MYANVLLITHSARPSLIGPLELADIVTHIIQSVSVQKLPLMVVFTNIINLYDNVSISNHQGLITCNRLTPLRSRHSGISSKIDLHLGSYILEKNSEIGFWISLLNLIMLILSLAAWMAVCISWSTMYCCIQNYCIEFSHCSASVAFKESYSWLSSVSGSTSGIGFEETSWTISFWVKT